MPRVEDVHTCAAKTHEAGVFEVLENASDDLARGALDSIGRKRSSRE